MMRLLVALLSCTQQIADQHCGRVHDLLFRLRVQRELVSEPHHLRSVRLTRGRTELLDGRPNLLVFLQHTWQLGSERVAHLHGLCRERVGNGAASRKRLKQTQGWQSNFFLSPEMW